jgi:hypothetical protein
VDYDMRYQEKDPTPFLEFSAVMFADKVTTPLLILHGEADQRVPTLQGREYFVLLAERGENGEDGDVSGFAAFSDAGGTAAECVSGALRLADEIQSSGLSKSAIVAHFSWRPFCLSCYVTGGGMAWLGPKMRVLYFSRGRRERTKKA